MSRSYKEPYQAVSGERPSGRKKSKALHNRAVRHANHIELEEHVALDGGEEFQSLEAKDVPKCRPMRKERMHPLTKKSLAHQVDYYASHRGMDTEKAEKVIKHRIYGK